MDEKNFLNELATAARAEASVKPVNPGELVIEIHGAIQRLTALYERLRTLIDYQEERFIRRLAIQRILFRRLNLEGQNEKIGEPLLKELIRAAYLENGKYTVSFAHSIDALLAKYLLALPTLEQRYSGRDLVKSQRKLIGLAAAEIEDLIDTPLVDEVLTERLAIEIASYQGGVVTNRERLTALRGLLKADEALCSWKLFKSAGESHAVWQTFSQDPVTHTADLLRELAKIEVEFNSNLVESATRRYHHLYPPYRILADWARKDPEQIRHIAEDPILLEDHLKQRVNERIDRSENKLKGAMVRTTAYIFMTKIVFGLVIEVPFDRLPNGGINWLPLLINIITPPLLMFLATLSIRPPSRQNTEILVQRAKQIVAGNELPKLAELEDHGLRSGSLNGVFSILYLLTYLVSFGGLIWLLLLVHYSLVSILVLLFFLCVVGFFAYRLRNTAKELEVVREKEGLTLLIFDFFAVPFLRIGRALSGTVRSLNVFLFVFDFLLEAPLKIFFVAIEDWFAFLREKREELG